MTRKLKSSREILACQLEGLYDGEKKLQHALHSMQSAAEGLVFKEELQKFESQCSDARMKLKRIFSYLLVEPYKMRNNIIGGFLKDLDGMTSAILDRRDAEMFISTGIHSINSYKVSAYGSALDLSYKLVLDPVSDLLNEIIDAAIACDSKLQTMQAQSSRSLKP